MTALNSTRRASDKSPYIKQNSFQLQKAVYQLFYLIYNDFSLVKTGDLRLGCVYIKDIDCELLIQSKDINDNILAVLCSVKDINFLLKRLSKKLNHLSEKR